MNIKVAAFTVSEKSSHTSFIALREAFKVHSGKVRHRGVVHMYLTGLHFYIDILKP